MYTVRADALAALVGGHLVGSAAASGSRVVIDTRGALRTDDIFVGLQGPRFSGGAFAAAAFAAGASIVVAPAAGALSVPEGAAAVLVADPLAALQTMAAAERARFSGPVVAITGSNGKTSTKEMLASALAGAVRVYASPMSYNSQVGVALTLLNMDLDADVALIECGISMPGEMERLEAMVRPTHGVFVNVGDAHLEGLHNRETVAAEKACLFGRLAADSWCVVPAEEALAVQALEAVHAPVVTIGSLTPPAPVSGPFRQDARLALAAAERLGADPTAARAALESWQAPPMRLEVSQTPRGVVVINDAYTADPVSMEAALVTLAQYVSTGKRVAVLGGMAQLGLRSAAAHAAVGARVAELGLDLLIGVGAGGREIVDAALQAGFPSQAALAVAVAADAATRLEEDVGAGDVVLLKASRPVGLERLAPVLFGSVEPARAYVDGEVLVQNLRAIERWVGPDVTVMSVVKSFGYGLDSLRTAHELQRAGARYFDVAIAEEAVALRDAGITTPSLVQPVVPEDATKVVRHGLTALVGSDSQRVSLADAAARARRRTRVHVKVDTGMSRAGARPEEAVQLAMAVVQDPWLELEGLMTHFAASDDPAEDAFTRQQIARFSQVIAGLAAQDVHPRYVHACNSAAIARFPEAHFTMVRSGLGLLGYTTVDGEPMLGTRPVLRLTTRVVAVRWVEEGEPVGYGLTWRAKARSRIAVVALGYGDGYPRALSNLGSMSVAGQLCPVVGRVCMDVTMLDVTAVPDAVEAGDEVVVFGSGPNEPDLGEHAELADTIPYEILARLSPRVRRIFHSAR